MSLSQLKYLLQRNKYTVTSVSLSKTRFRNSGKVIIVIYLTGTVHINQHFSFHFSVTESIKGCKSFTCEASVEVLSLLLTEDRLKDTK